MISDFTKRTQRRVVHSSPSARPVLADMPHAILHGCVHVSECATGNALSLGNIHPLAYITLMPELFCSMKEITDMYAMLQPNIT